MHYLEHLYEKAHYCSVVSGGPKSGKPTYNLWLFPFLSPPPPPPLEREAACLTLHSNPILFLNRNLKCLFHIRGLTPK